jgi:MFS family permease
MLKDYLQLPRAVHVLCVGTLINRAGSFVLVFLTSYVSINLGLGADVAGKVVMTYGIGAVGASLLGGYLADRVGRRIVMIASLVGGAVILTIFGYLRSPVSIMFAAFLFALTIDMYRPAAAAMISDLVAPAQRSHAFGLMYVSINLGFSIAPVVGGIVAAKSFLWLFWGDAVTTFIYAVIIVAAIRETLPRSAASDGEPEGSRDSGTGRQAGVRGEYIPLAQAARHIAMDGTFLVYCLASLAVAMIYQQAFTTFPIHLNSYGIGPNIYGLIIAVNGALIVIFQLPFTAFLNRFKRASVLTAAAAVIAVGIGSIALPSTAWGFALTVVVWTIGEMMDAPVKFSVAADLAPKALRARYMGLIGMSFSTALAIGGPLGGFTLARLGPEFLWGGCLVVGMLAFVMCLAIHRRLTAAQFRQEGEAVELVQ